MRGEICSLLPSATEIVFALGVDDRLVGVTHECDYPAATGTSPARCPREAASICSISVTYARSPGAPAVNRYAVTTLSP